jgi:ABC-type branched-subunit amino acid transport system substrate-binding protein
MKKALLTMLLAAAWPAAAQDAYVVGVSAAMTGPAAGIYAPVVDAMKAYLDHVNARGGVNGKPCA